MLFSRVVQCSEAVAATGSRNEKSRMLAELIGGLTSREEIVVAVHFLTGGLRQGRIGLGPSAIRAARPDDNAKEPQLSLLHVDETFARIADITGSGSTRARTTVLRDLLTRATNAEQRFLTRLVFGELHQGAMEGVMLDAIAQAASVPVATIRRAVMATGDLTGVAATAVLDGHQALSALSVQIFQPLQPMLAQPASDPAEVFATDKPFVAEWKLDGARIQVHKLGGDVRVYSRGLRDVTHAAPEIVELVRSYPQQSLVLDGEVIALRKDGRPHLFQTTMRRFGRKLNIRQLRSELPLTPFFFDILLLEDTPVIDMSLEERLDFLDTAVGAAAVQRRHVSDVDAASTFLREAMRAGHEGIMLKSLRSTYEAGARGADWFKIKPAHTLDLVVLAADWGHGRRTGWLSNLHLGARDRETNSFVMLGKTFKGMTDKMLEWQTKQLLSLEIARDKYTVHVQPSLVVEVAFNDLQKSSRYPGGLALRFARVKRYRSDKAPEEVDTLETARAIYHASAPDLTTGTTRRDTTD